MVRLAELETNQELLDLLDAKKNVWTRKGLKRGAKVCHLVS